MTPAGPDLPPRPPLFLRLFGGLSLENGGRPLGAAAGQPKRLALLAILARSGEVGSSRDKISALLWEERDAAKARSALSQALYALRQDLPEDPIDDLGATIRLNRRTVGSDLAEFEAALERGDLAAATGLYRGPFLDGIHVRDSVSFEEWAERERDQLIRRYRGLLGELAGRAEKAGDIGEQTVWLQQLVEADPHNADAVRRLMEAAAARGDRGQAISIGERYCIRMREGLELEPELAIGTLIERLRSEARVTAEPAAGSPRRPVLPTSPTVFESTPRPEIDRRPSRRRLVWLLAAGAVLTLVAAAVLSRTNRLSPTRVLLLVREPASADSVVQAASQSVQDWLLIGLTQTQRLDPATEVYRESTTLSTADAAGLGRKSRAGSVVALELRHIADSMSVTATIVDANLGRILGIANARIALPASDFGALAEEVRQRVMGILASQEDAELARWADSGSRPTTWKAYQLFTAGRDAYVRCCDTSAIGLLQKAIAADSAFTLPRVWLMFAYLGQASNRWSSPEPLLSAADSLRRQLVGLRPSLPPGDRALLDMAEGLLDNNPDLAYEAAQRVAMAVPGTEWNYWVAQAALEAGYPNGALGWLDRLPQNASWRLTHNGADYWNMRMHIRMDARDYHGFLADADSLVKLPGWDGLAQMFRVLGLAGLGRAEEALELMRGVAAGRLPTGHFSVDDMARISAPLLQAAGRQDIVVRALAIADSFQTANGHPAAFRAPLWYWRRDWPRARALYDSAATMLPRYIGANNWTIVSTIQGRRGGLAARVGDTATARSLEQWLERTSDSLALHPRGGRYFLLARARIESALGHTVQALELLRAAGTYNYFPPIWFDSEFEALHGNMVYERLMRPRDAPGATAIHK